MARPADIPAPESDPVLFVDGLCIERSSNPVLAGVSFSLAPGEVLGVIGPNGAGKSTLLKGLCGQVRPSAGRVVISDHGRFARALGYAPQRSALFDRLTALENVKACARIAGVERSAITAAALEALERVEGEGNAEKLAGRLSGGQRQRINIACALVGQPAALALDEPTASLDPAATRSLGDLIRKLGDDGQAAIVVTHDLDEAERICDRVMIIRNGGVAALDAPAALIRRFAGEAVDIAIEFAGSVRSSGQLRLAAFGFAKGAGDCWRMRVETHAAALGMMQNVTAHFELPAIAHASLSRPGLRRVLSALASEPHLAHETNAKCA